MELRDMLKKGPGPFVDLDPGMSSAKDVLTMLLHGPFQQLFMKIDTILADYDLRMKAMQAENTILKVKIGVMEKQIIGLKRAGARRRRSNAKS